MENSSIPLRDYESCSVARKGIKKIKSRNERISDNKRLFTFLKVLVKAPHRVLASSLSEIHSVVLLQSFLNSESVHRHIQTDCCSSKL
jgi:hypothetical protein